MDILADTNILLRRIHRRDPQHRITQRCLNRLIKEGNRICVTSQNLIELWTVCTRPNDNNGLGLTVAQTERILTRLERSVVRLPDVDNEQSGKYVDVFDIDQNDQWRTIRDDEHQRSCGNNSRRLSRSASRSSNVGEPSRTLWRLR